MKLRFYLLPLIFLGLISCGKSGKELQAEQEAKKKAELLAYQKAFKVAVMPTMDCLPAYVLKDSMLYDTAKVDIRLKEFNAQMDCDTAMLGGSVQAAFTDLIRAERLRHNKHVLMHFLTGTNLQWKLIANNQSHVKKVSDLSDHIIAISRFSGTDYFTDQVLIKAKPKYKVFRVQVNDIFVRLKMLENHEVDAFWFSEPQATKALLDGNSVLYDASNDNINLGVIVVLDNKSRLKEEQAFSEAYDKAVDQINKYGVKHYAAIIKKYMGASDAVINALPDMKYTKVVRPQQTDILSALKYVANIKR